MNKNSKLKIIFYACHSTTSLKECWHHLKDKADCCWVTAHSIVYKELKENGYKNIVFYGLADRIAGSDIFSKIIRTIHSLYLQKYSKKAAARAIDKLSPDIVISNSTMVLSKYIPRRLRTMKVQVFHSVPYKKYIMYPETTTYDLVLCPSAYHKQTLQERFNVRDVDKLKVVGWPRADDYISKNLSSDARRVVMKELGLNPDLKTVLFAPTWDAFYNGELFPKSFGYYLDALEAFCSGLKKINVNLAVKLHTCSYKLMNDLAFRKIFEKYNVYFEDNEKKTGIYFSHKITRELSFIADILISDVSGIITDFMILNRPIIYIEPEVDPDGKEINWRETDLPKEFRAGAVVKSLDELIESVKQALDNPDEYRSKREEVLQKIFFNLDGRSAERASDTILNYYEEFLKKRMPSCPEN